MLTIKNSVFLLGWVAMHSTALLGPGEWSTNRPGQGVPEHEVLADTRFPQIKATHGHGNGNGNAHHAHRLETRTTTRGVYECMNKNFVLPCIWTPVNNGQCYNRNYGAQGSMGPDKGLTCIVYERKNCNDNGWLRADPFVWPGIPDYQTSYLLTRHGFPEDGPFSYKCTYTSEAKGH